MATVSKNKIWFNGKSFMQEIKVDSKGVFTCKVPVEVCEALGVELVQATTLSACDSEFQKALKQYESIKSSKRKVILYKLDTQAKIYRKDCLIHNTSDFHFNDGCVVGIVAGVFTETKLELVGGQFRYAYEKDTTSKLLRTAFWPIKWDTFSTHGQRETDQIEWTQEREDFLWKLANAMESIILEVEKLRTPENLQNVIAAGGFKMLPPSK